MDRSPTAESILKQRSGYEVKSAGTWYYAHKRVTEDMIDWADIIFVMEKNHVQTLLYLNPKSKDKIINLDIPDIYPRSNPELINILQNKLAKFLQIEW
jgi:predicted protein tyrosine phosphatase